jgi:hypothetical protein
VRASDRFVIATGDVDWIIGGDFTIFQVLGAKVPHTLACGMNDLLVG